MIQPTNSATGADAQQFIQGLFSQNNVQPEASSESVSQSSASGMKQTLELMMTASSGDPMLDAQSLKMMIALYILQMLLDPGGQGQQTSMPDLLDSLSRDEVTLSASISQESFQMSHNTYARQAYQSSGSSVSSVDTVAE